jgi:hypothetical protein
MGNTRPCCKTQVPCARRDPSYSRGMRRRGLSFVASASATALLITACGRTLMDVPDEGGAPETPATTNGSGGPTAPSVGDGATSVPGAAGDVKSDSAPTTTCIPGRSIACVGPGGCSSNQVCKDDGSGYGPCSCTPEAAAVCVPGQSIACAGSGGCVSSQVCKADGSGYGPCVCGGDGGPPLLCVPGQSISCAGPDGCTSYQVCNQAGDGYGPCECPDASSFTLLEGGIECLTPSDCQALLGPLSRMCIIPCPNGQEGCLHYVCVSGICQQSMCN